MFSKGHHNRYLNCQQYLSPGMEVITRYANSTKSTSANHILVLSSGHYLLSFIHFKRVLAKGQVRFVHFLFAVKQLQRQNARDFSPRVQSLLVSVHQCAQLHTLTPVHTLKIL